MEAKEIDEVVGRARARLANANWDASKHPRGAGGRFGKGDGGKKDESEIDLDEYSRRSAASDHTRRSVKLDELDKKKASDKKPYWADSIQRAREALAKRNAAKKEQSAKKPAERSKNVEPRDFKEYFDTSIDDSKSLLAEVEKSKYVSPEQAALAQRLELELGNIENFRSYEFDRKFSEFTKKHGVNYSDKEYEEWRKNTKEAKDLDYIRKGLRSDGSIIFKLKEVSSRFLREFDGNGAGDKFDQAIKAIREASKKLPQARRSKDFSEYKKASDRFWGMSDNA